MPVDLFRGTPLQASLLCCAFGLASSLGCNGQDGTQLTPGNRGGTGGSTGSLAGSSGASGQGSGGSGVAGSAAGTGGASGGAGGDAGVQACTGTPWSSFIEARGICGEDCRVCAVDIVDNQPVHYFTLFGAGCGCPATAPDWPDAGVSGPPPACSARGGFLTEEQALSSCAGDGGDAGACRSCREDNSGAMPARSWSVTRAECECPTTLGYECGSYPNLSEAEATTMCTGLTDCRVCVQQLDPAGTPELWMAHACGCPAPYRRTE